MVQRHSLTAFVAPQRPAGESVVHVGCVSACEHFQPWHVTVEAHDSVSRLVRFPRVVGDVAFQQLRHALVFAFESLAASSQQADFGVCPRVLPHPEVVPFCGRVYFDPCERDRFIFVSQLKGLDFDVTLRNQLISLKDELLEKTFALKGQ